MRLTFLLLSSAALAFLSGGALRAHGLQAVARRDGDQVVIEAFFTRQSPACDARVAVSDSHGRALANGVTDAMGTFRFRLVEGRDLVVVIQDDQGHRARLDLSARAIDENRGTDGNQRIIGRSSTPWLSRYGPAWARIAGGVAAVAFLTLVGWFIYRRRTTGDAR